jgi:hypothetical protein
MRGTTLVYAEAYAQSDNGGPYAVLRRLLQTEFP